MPQERVYDTRGAASGLHVHTDFLQTEILRLLIVSVSVQHTTRKYPLGPRQLRASKISHL